MNKIMKRSLTVLMGIMFLSVGNVFGLTGNEINPARYFNQDKNVTECLMDCKEAAHDFFRDRMRYLFGKNNSVNVATGEYVNAYTEMATNFNLCDNEFFKRVTMRTFNSTINPI